MSTNNYSGSDFDFEGVLLSRDSIPLGPELSLDLDLGPVPSLGCLLQVVRRGERVIALASSSQTT
jgi:hypothetical protein